MISTFARMGTTTVLRLQALGDRLLGAFLALPVQQGPLGLLELLVPPELLARLVLRDLRES